MSLHRSVEYDRGVRDALLLDARLLRVSTEHDAGLLTPAGMRLTITRKVLDAADLSPPRRYRRHVLAMREIERSDGPRSRLLLRQSQVLGITASDRMLSRSFPSGPS
jgi:hypothetical protein